MEGAVNTLLLAGAEGKAANTSMPEIIITDGIHNDLVKLVEGLKRCSLREEDGVIIYEEDNL